MLVGNLDARRLAFGLPAPDACWHDTKAPQQRGVFLGIRLADAGTGKVYHQLREGRHPLPALDHVELDCAPQPDTVSQPERRELLRDADWPGWRVAIRGECSNVRVRSPQEPLHEVCATVRGGFRRPCRNLGTAERTHGEPKCRLVVMDVFVDVQEVTVEIARPARFREVCHALSEIGLEIVHRRHRGRSAGFAWLVCDLP